MAESVRVPKYLWLRNFWVRPHEGSIAYGLHALYFALGVGGSLVFGVTALISYHVGATTLGVVAFMLMLVVNAVSWLRGYRYIGWYEVNTRGAPVAFMGHRPPQDIDMGARMTRGRFLREMKNAS